MRKASKQCILGTGLYFEEMKNGQVLSGEIA